MEKNQKENKRREVKFICPITDIASVIGKLNLSGYREQYPMRTVSSYYFDTLNDQFLYDSIYGLQDRKKIRIRYYNNELEFQFEKKVKNNFLGHKEVKYSNLTVSDIRLKREHIEKIASEWGSVSLKLKSFVTYKRKYYFNNIQNTRVTLDYDINTYDFEKNRSREFRGNCIIEVKCDEETKTELPFSLTPIRWSKYAFSRLGDDTDY